jgi:hypothetical protein
MLLFLINVIRVVLEKDGLHVRRKNLNYSYPIELTYHPSFQYDTL